MIVCQYIDVAVVSYGNPHACIGELPARNATGVDYLLLIYQGKPPGSMKSINIDQDQCIH